MSQSIYGRVYISPAEQRRLERERQRRLEEERRRQEEERKRQEEEKRKAEIAAEKERLEKERRILGDADSRRRSLLRGRLEQMQRAAFSRSNRETFGTVEWEAITQRIESASVEELQSLIKEIEMLEQTPRAKSTHNNKTEDKTIPDTVTSEEIQLHIKSALLFSQNLAEVYGKLCENDVREIQSTLQVLTTDRSGNNTYISSIVKGVEDRLRMLSKEMGRLVTLRKQKVEKEREEIIKLLSKLEVIVKSSISEENKRPARTLIALLEHAVALDNPEEISNERDKMQSEVFKLWKSFGDHQHNSDEQGFIMNNVTEVLKEMGYEVVIPPHRELQILSSPLYVNYLIPGGQEIQIGFSQTGDLVAEVIQYVDEDTSKPASDATVKVLKSQTERWCSDYRQMIDVLSARGLTLETKFLHDFDLSKIKTKKAAEKAKEHRVKSQPAQWEIEEIKRRSMQ